MRFAHVATFHVHHRPVDAEAFAPPVLQLACLAYVGDNLPPTAYVPATTEQATRAFRSAGPVFPCH